MRDFIRNRLGLLRCARSGGDANRLRARRCRRRHIKVQRLPRSIPVDCFRRRFEHRRLTDQQGIRLGEVCGNVNIVDGGIERLLVLPDEQYRFSAIGGGNGLAIKIATRRGKPRNQQDEPAPFPKERDVTPDFQHDTCIAKDSGAGVPRSSYSTTAWLESKGILFPIFPAAAWRVPPRYPG